MIWELNHKESWVLKNWCFWTVVLKKTLEVLWTARRLNQSILKEIRPEYSLEGLMLKLKLQYFGHLMWRTDSLEKTLMLVKNWLTGKDPDACEELTHWKRPWRWERLKAGGEEDDRGWDGWMASLTQWTWVWASSGSWWWRGKPSLLQSMASQRVGHNWATELNWTDCFSSNVIYRRMGQGGSGQNLWVQGRREDDLWDLFPC